MMSRLIASSLAAGRSSVAHLVAIGLMRQQAARASFHDLVARDRASFKIFEAPNYDVPKRLLDKHGNFAIRIVILRFNHI